MIAADTDTATRNARTNPGVFLFILILIVLSLLAMIIRFQTDHGKLKHNREPDLAERCLNRHGVAYAFVEAASGRIHLICTESDTDKDRGTLDGITAFRVQSYTYRELRTLSTRSTSILNSWRGAAIPCSTRLNSQGRSHLFGRSFRDRKSQKKIIKRSRVSIAPRSYRTGAYLFNPNYSNQIPGGTCSL